MSNQQGDVTLLQHSDGGEISVINGVVEMSGGLETSVYLALFGGNEDDQGRALNQFSWWGNAGEVTEKHYRSKTQNLLQSLPAISVNLRRVEDAAQSDLAYLINLKIASSVDVFASIPAVNEFNVSVTIRAEGKEIEFNFTENWTRLQIDV